MNDVQEYTFESTYLNIGYFSIFKCGRLCIFNAPTAVKNLPATASTKIATLPEELRPMGNVDIRFTVPSSTNTVSLSINATTGDVNLYNYTSSTGSLNIRMQTIYFSSK